MACMTQWLQPGVSMGKELRGSSSMNKKGSGKC